MLKHDLPHWSIYHVSPKVPITSSTFAAAPGKYIPVPYQLFWLTFYPHMLEIGTKFFLGCSKYQKIKWRKFADSEIKKISNWYTHLMLPLEMCHPKHVLALLVPRNTLHNNTENNLSWLVTGVSVKCKLICCLISLLWITKYTVITEWYGNRILNRTYQNLLIKTDSSFQCWIRWNLSGN